MTDATTERGNPRLALLLCMAMFVLVVDTSIMNVSISAVVHDLHTDVSSVQSAIALGSVPTRADGQPIPLLELMNRLLEGTVGNPNLGTEAAG